MKTKTTKRPAVQLDPGSLYLTPSGRICRCVATTRGQGEPDEAELVYDNPGGGGSFTLARPNWHLLQKVAS